MEFSSNFNDIEDLLYSVWVCIEELHIRNKLFREINIVTNYGNKTIKRINTFKKNMREYIPP
jgi:hypothetical protein